MTRNLGQKRATYQNNSRSIFSYRKTWSGFFIPLLVIMIFAGQTIFWSENDKNSQTPGIVLSIVGLIGILAIVYFVIRNRNNYVDLHEYGFVFGKKGEVITVYFDEIKSILWSSIEVRRWAFIWTLEEYSFKVEKTDGSILKLTNFNTYKVLDLGFQIQKSYSALQIPRLIASLYNGEEVKIYDFTLTKEGIKYKKKTIFWDQVGFAKIDRGFVRVYTKDHSEIWELLTALHRPNAMLMHDLINTYLHTYQLK